MADRGGMREKAGTGGGEVSGGLALDFRPSITSKPIGADFGGERLGAEAEFVDVYDAVVIRIGELAAGGGT